MKKNWFVYDFIKKFAENFNLSTFRKEAKNDKLFCFSGRKKKIWEFEISKFQIFNKNFKINHIYLYFFSIFNLNKYILVKFEKFYYFVVISDW